MAVHNYIMDISYLEEHFMVFRVRLYFVHHLDSLMKILAMFVNHELFECYCLNSFPRGLSWL